MRILSLILLIICFGFSAGSFARHKKSRRHTYKKRYRRKYRSKIVKVKKSPEELARLFPLPISYIKKVTSPVTARCLAEETSFESTDSSVDNFQDIYRDSNSTGSKKDTLRWLVSNLKGGTYKFLRKPGPLKEADHVDICKSFNKALNGEQVTTPIAGHCASASYLGVLLMLKQHRPELLDKHKSEFGCKVGGRQGWKYSKSYVLFANDFDKWAKRYLGKENLTWVRTKKLDQLVKDKGLPAIGDSMVLNRNRSGHSVIFSHFEKNKQGKIDKICYWSSNSNPRQKAAKGYRDGMGLRCEPKKKIKSISIGHI